MAPAAGITFPATKGDGEAPQWRVAFHLQKRRVAFAPKTDWSFNHIVLKKMVRPYTEFKEEMLDHLDVIIDEHPNADDGWALLAKASSMVLDRWLENGRFSQLVSWYNENCDCGGETEILFRICNRLKKEELAELLCELIRGALRIRNNRYFLHRNSLKRIDAEKHPEAIRDAHDAMASLKKECIEIYEYYLSSLEQFNLPDEADWYRNDYQRFLEDKRPVKRKK